MPRHCNGPDLRDSPEQNQATLLVGRYNGPMTRITPARIRFEGNSLCAPEFGDVYHSTDGGVEQALQVFLKGNALPERWQGRPDFQILELGFGIGLNFLVTWHAWRTQAPPSAHSRLHFVSCEQFPPTREDLERAHQAYPSLAPLCSLLQAAWPPLVSGTHQCEFDDGRVTLTLVLGDVQDTLPGLSMAADAVYLDGFSPVKNPLMWNEPVMRHVARQCVRLATLATWCVAGAVRRALEAQGFTTRRCPGYGRKRERLEARFDRIPAEAFQRMATPGRNPVLARRTAQPWPARHAAVIGAGMAGCLMTEHLCRLGWQVDLFDFHEGPAREASGNPAGIFRPLLSRDDNLASRLTRVGFLHTLATLERLQHLTGVVRRGSPGVLVLAGDGTEQAAQEQLIAQQDLPPDFAHYLSPAQIGRQWGIATACGGTVFPRAGWVDPASLCQAALQAAKARLHPHWGVRIGALEREEEWRLFDTQGCLQVRAPVVVLALGAHSKALDQTASLPLSSLRGQITQLDHDPLPAHAPVICQQGYLIPGLEAGLCIGATFDEGTETSPDPGATRSNLERLQRVLPDWVPQSPPLRERVGFRNMARDRMPVVGALPGAPGLYATMGMGSHGLAWSSVSAALVAALLEGTPLPLEKALVRAIAPARFT